MAILCLLLKDQKGSESPFSLEQTGLCNNEQAVKHAQQLQQDFQMLERAKLTLRPGLTSNSQQLASTSMLLRVPTSTSAAERALGMLGVVRVRGKILPHGACCLGGMP